MSEDHYDYDDLPGGDGILILSADQVILSATLQAERLLRRRFAPGQTLPLSEIFPEAYLAQAELALKETLASGVMRAQILTQIRLPSEQARFLKYSVAPLYSPDQKITGAVLAFHDDPHTKSRSAWDNLGLGVGPERGVRAPGPRSVHRQPPADHNRVQPHGPGAHRL